ncbi:MAG: four helix bundle protein [Bacteroidota bacterium]
MFDFQKLQVYQKAKSFRKDIKDLIHQFKFDRTTVDQLSRASVSIVLNIAEGSSRFSNRDRRYFMVFARGSVFECVAILELLEENGEIPSEVYRAFLSQLEELSKMLFGLIRKLE